MWRNWIARGTTREHLPPRMQRKRYQAREMRTVAHCIAVPCLFPRKVPTSRCPFLSTTSPASDVFQQGIRDSAAILRCILAPDVSDLFLLPHASREVNARQSKNRNAKKKVSQGLKASGA